MSLVEKHSDKLGLPQLTGTGARALIWVYYGTLSVLAVLSLDDVHNPVIVYISIVTFGAIWLALTKEKTLVVRQAVCIFAVAASVFTTLISSWNSIHGGFSQWYVGSGALAMLYLSLRGRNLAAWFGFIGIGTVVVIWGLTTEDRLAEALLLVARQAPFIVVSTLFSIGMRRAGRRLDAAHALETAQAAAEAAALARSSERSLRLTALDAAVGPQLRLLASGGNLTDEDHKDLLIAEARLRDSLRARQLEVPEIVEATSRARHRGVTVLLLDDRSPTPLPPGALSDVADAAVAALDAAEAGSLTIRLLPAGRPLLATIVSDSEHYSRVEIPS